MHGTRKLLQRQDASTSNKNRPRTPRNLAKRGVLQAAELPALSSTALTWSDYSRSTPSNSFPPTGHRSMLSGEHQGVSERNKNLFNASLFCLECDNVHQLFVELNNQVPLPGYCPKAVETRAACFDRLARSCWQKECFQSWNAARAIAKERAIKVNLKLSCEGQAKVGSAFAKRSPASEMTPPHYALLRPVKTQRTEDKRISVKCVRNSTPPHIL